jgi:N-acyl-phosphatidylethanolamine-hydrolysing phospholipase D
VPVYTNLDGTTPDKGLKDILKWQISDRLAGKRTRPSSEVFVTPRRTHDPTLVASANASLTWIGHATFAMRLGGKLIVTDPIWSERLSPVTKRLCDPGIELHAMPTIDIVTVSHSHFDHLDMPTLKRIGPRALYIVPKDVGEILIAGGLRNVVELGWWESHRVGDVKITLVPSQHWSMRAPWDRNKRLWGGFIYEAPEGVAYHAGDTAMSELVFGEIRKRHDHIDWAMLPIGAYDPPWFMQPQHMGPEEALSAFDILGAKTFCAMHWGTFKLTDEPLGEPPERLVDAWNRTRQDVTRRWIFDIGETRSLVR